MRTRLFFKKKSKENLLVKNNIKFFNKEEDISHKLT